jgi:hypothetical protein
MKVYRREKYSVAKYRYGIKYLAGVCDTPTRLKQGYHTDASHPL